MNRVHLTGPRLFVLLLLLAAGCESNMDNPADPEAGTYIGYRPWVDAGDDIRATIEDTLSFAGVFHGPQDKVERYEWDLNGDARADFASASSAVSLWSYGAVGEYLAVFTVWDRAGFSRRDTSRVTVTNQTPRALAGPDRYGFLNRTVAFPAAGSDDGRLVAYRWDFQGDGEVDWSAATPGTPLYLYTAPGVYAAVLEVRDDDGNLGRDTVLVSISLGFPTAKAGRDTAVSIRDVVKFHGSGMDTNGTVVLYEWDLDGDGVTDQSSTVHGRADRSFETVGIRDAVLTVTDDDGFHGRDTVRVAVTDEIPVIDVLDLGDGWCAEPETLAAHVSDDGHIVLYEWDFEGDGIFDESIESGNLAVHAFPMGDYRPRLRVTDDDGHAVAGTLSFSVTPWAFGPPMNIPRAGVGVQAVNGILYALAGYSYGIGQYMSAAEAFDPAEWRWEARRPMTLPQFGLATTVVGDRIYGVAGCTRYDSRGAVEEYWPEYDLWSRKASVQIRRCWPTAATAMGRVYVFGGMDDGEMSSTETLDPELSIWEEVAPMPTPRHGMASVVVDDLVYLIGGTGASGELGNVEVYDPAADRWEIRSPMPTPRSSLAAVSLEGKIYAIGGSFTNTVEVYDIATDTWYTGTPMRIPRYGHGAAVIGDRIYVVGGESYNGYLAELEVYAPLCDVLRR